MNFKIKSTEDADQDLSEIYERIAYDFREPLAAKEQVKRIARKIRSLRAFPMRYPFYGEEPWRSRGFRFFPVDSYLVFYRVDEENSFIEVTRIIHGSRNVPAVLNESS